MKKVLLTGATGMTGKIVQRLCLADDQIGEVVSFVRRPSGTQHERLNEIVLSDFTDYSAHPEAFATVDAAYFCLGVYTGAVSRDKFREITVDYTIAFADALKAASPGANFCFLSGAGADREEKSRMMFAKDKGIAENYLLKCGFGGLYIFRPGYIYPVEPRKEPNFSYRFFRAIYPMVKGMMQKTSITSEALAAGMFKAGMEGAKRDTLENIHIKKLL